MIEFAACTGTPIIDIVNNPTDKFTGTMTNVKKREANGRMNYFIPLPRENLYILVRPEQSLNSEEATSAKTEFLIKVKYSLYALTQQVNYQF